MHDQHYAMHMLVRHYLNVTVGLLCGDFIFDTVLYAVKIVANY